MPLLAALPIALCALVALCASAARAATSLGAVRADMSHEIGLAGPSSGAYVYDLTTRQTLFSERAEMPRPPASVEKLYTSATLLERMGPSARLSTSVLGDGRLVPGETWEGDLYLHGGGDPTFGSPSFVHGHYAGHGASVSALVDQLVRVDGIHRITGNVQGDESYLDSLRAGPATGYRPDPFLEGTLSGLAFDRGASGPETGPHAPAAFAARELWAALKNDGVTVEGSSGAATAPAGTTVLAQVQSPPVSQLLRLMLPPSDNFFAELLLKDLGASFAGAGTTAAGASVVRRTLSPLGIAPHVVDGSGLSHANLTTPHQVVALLSNLASVSLGTVLRSDMAVAGHTGTLASRMRGTTAAGRCQGKTGTLLGVSNLAGYCQAVNGHILAFAFFTDGIETGAAHTLQDHMAITLAGY
ncbi:MAG TPA: D-alanyl-D-alanine carboxypeptidase/D-alanyl-D-alanine-endopeptidase [Solirubrobacteraceae bacterium]|jgi:D-alanyl-D-alanine carboxypeptidase/D-alanyl-D-alanine-endopeptidase (penicillin-binding protein 4)